jgi:ribosomal protein S10
MTVCLSIEPDGSHRIICSGDHLHAESQFSCWGLSFPQSSVDTNQINKYCTQIVEQCKQRDIYGYFDVDFVTFIDAQTDKQHIWATDISIGYSEHVSLYRVMHFVTAGHFNASTHSYTIQVKQGKQTSKQIERLTQEHKVRQRCYRLIVTQLFIVKHRRWRRMFMLYGVHVCIIRVYPYCNTVSSFKCAVHMVLASIFINGKAVYLHCSSLIDMKISA